MKLLPRRDLYPGNGKGYSLFALLWLSYFAANLGRLSYVTVMIEIINREGFSAAAAGLVGTGFFICYGAGQIGSGYLGDRLPPRWLIFTGLLCTGLANFAMGLARTSAQMLVIWCFNGLIQSILWPPIVRVIVERYPSPAREKVCVNISTTYPIATLVSYAACAGIILVLPWRAFFFIVTVFLFAVSALWGVVFGKVECGPGVPRGERLEPEAGVLPGKISRRKKLPFVVLIIICGALIAQGALRDGLTTWIPAYLTQTFSLQTSTAILFSGLLPLINIAGIYVCQFLFRLIKDEVRTALCLYCVSALVALVLRFLGSFHIILSLAPFALITACMIGVNLMLVVFVPTHFSRMGIVAFISGVTNAMVYVGSSVATFGIGLAADTFGWGSLLLILVSLTLLSALLCLLASPRWQAFTRQESLELTAQKAS
jgi:OPA family glycerol-3-phosphate transporter-like MFS transporter